MSVDFNSIDYGVPCLTLNDGKRIPQVGFGVYELEGGDVCEKAVSLAIEAGYRHFDTAQHYYNEESVGAAIRASGLPRENFYITTKTPWVITRDSIRAEIEKSLKLMGTDYVDLYLIHWPTGNVIEAWEAILELRGEGVFRSIGVSNFTKRRFEEVVFPHFTKPEEAPAVNQIEHHVYNHQAELFDYCVQKGIRVMAYSPLARASKEHPPNLQEIADAHGKSPQQIMLRWALQQDVVIIPKTSKFERMKQNLDLFDFALDEQEMKRLGDLDEGHFALEFRPKGFF